MERMYSAQEVIENLKPIISERECLRRELNLSKQAIKEYELQIIELHRLLTKTQRQLSVENPTRQSTGALCRAFLGTWRVSPSEYPALIPVETAWAHGHLQQALSQMPALLQREDLGHRHRINARLLYSAILHDSARDIETALKYAEEALQLALDHRLYELVGKAHFHRGLCHYLLSEPANAKWCLILASRLEGHEDIIEEIRAKLEELLNALPKNDPKRSVSAKLNFFGCSGTDR